MYVLFDGCDAAKMTTSINCNWRICLMNIDLFCDWMKWKSAPSTPIKTLMFLSLSETTVTSIRPLESALSIASCSLFKQATSLCMCALLSSLNDATSASIDWRALGGSQSDTSLTYTYPLRKYTASATVMEECTLQTESIVIMQSASTIPSLYQNVKECNFNWIDYKGFSPYICTYFTFCMFCSSHRWADSFTVSGVHPLRAKGVFVRCSGLQQSLDLRNSLRLCSGQVCQEKGSGRLEAKLRATLFGWKRVSMQVRDEYYTCSLSPLLHISQPLSTSCSCPCFSQLSILYLGMSCVNDLRLRETGFSKSMDYASYVFEMRAGCDL